MTTEKAILKYMDMKNNSTLDEHLYNVSDHKVMVYTIHRDAIPQTKEAKENKAFIHKIHWRLIVYCITQRQSHLDALSYPHQDTLSAPLLPTINAWWTFWLSPVVKRYLKRSF